MDRFPRAETANAMNWMIRAQSERETGTFPGRHMAPVDADYLPGWCGPTSD
ncbi:hypothetical protein [Mesorhizobium sp. B1-1-8]|uniref:hypothetical protein n=1 Tax=Mesorhizobium sp. B1-1-8 TaxID=2589976 RepID=UPI0015E43C9F|nr:hypothetical protein [Mesorhizobium sp. B1-1-8]UCI05543.1 hypothetical protein FJ974_17015 [Mesorhizobium sp. B1-1-8]